MNNKIIKGFIVFEGIDGSGTTTQMNRLAERLKRLNIPVRCDAEPTGSAAGRRLRTLLKTGNAGNCPVGSPDLCRKVRESGEFVSVDGRHVRKE